MPECSGTISDTTLIYPLPDGRWAWHAAAARHGEGGNAPTRAAAQAAADLALVRLRQWEEEYS